MTTEIIIACVGVASSVISAFVTHVLTKKKYNSEVDNNLIQNMRESLEFYKQLSDDNKNRLEEVLKRNELLEKRNEKLEEEMKEVKNQMFNLMTKICLDLTCKVRQQELFGTTNK